VWERELTLPTKGKKGATTTNVHTAPSLCCFGSRAQNTVSLQNPYDPKTRRKRGSSHGQGQPALFPLIPLRLPAARGGVRRIKRGHAHGVRHIHKLTLASLKRCLNP